MAARKKTTRLRIEAIEIQSSTLSSHPVNLKILSNDIVLENLATVRPGQQLYWDEIKPFNVDPTSNIELRIYQIHKMGIVRLRVGSVIFAASTSEAKIVRDTAGPTSFTIVITLLPEAPQAPQAAYRSALNAVENFPSVLDSFGRARGAVESILGFGSAVAELNPIAKAALAVCTKAWEILKKQDQCDTVTADLVFGLGDMIPVVEAVPDRAKAERLRTTIADILRLVEDGCNFVVEYRSDGAAVRTLRAFAVSNAQEQVDEYLKELGRLKEKFDREMVVHVAETTETLLTDADQTLIDRLLTSQAGYDYHSICLAGTRENILGDILKWATKPDDPISFFWLHGLAGSGKTTIAASISMELQGTGCLAGSFFCKHDDQQLREPKNLVSTLAARLARAHKPYGVKLVKALREDPDIFHSALPIRFKRLILDLLQGISRPSSGKCLVVVVDALDECGTPDSRKQILSGLLQLVGLASWLKILLTSRPNDEIRQALIDVQTPQLYARDIFSEDQARVTSDISMFVGARLRDIPSKDMGRSTWPEDDVIREISSRAAGLFIWAETACRFITLGLDPKTRLKQILAGQRSNDANKRLNELYTTALDKSFDGADDNAQIIRQCIGAIVLTGVYSPLSDAVLGALLDEYVDAGVLRRVIDDLGSVVYRDKSGAVRVLHQSFSDFVLDEVQCPPKYRIDIMLQNAELATCCLRNMIKGLQFNICDLKNSYILNDRVPDLAARVERCISAHLAYSCLHWIGHLTSASRGLLELELPSDSRFVVALDTFVTQPVSLYWIESLILLSGLRAALTSLPKLLDWIGDGRYPYSQWADDIHRFIFAFYHPIVNSVPHLYVSALPFGAANYETVRRWKSLFQGTMTVTQGENLLSSPCLRIVGGFLDPDPRVRCISPDGKRIILTKPRELISLDAETGEFHWMASLEHSQDLTCAACSQDNKLIASGSEDATIHVQNFGENSTFISRVLRGHTDWIIMVLFSPNGRRVISGSYDQTIRVWDIESGVQVAEIQLEHSSPITSMRLSSDGRFLTSTFKNDMLLLWEIEAQNVSIRSLQKFPQPVKVAFAFSSDGSVLVAGTDERKIYIWDVPTGKLSLGPIEAHAGGITCVGLSPDDRLIASGSDDGEIRIWDAHTGAVACELLTGHSGPITGVLFTLDSQRIISSSGDHTIRIWRVPEQKPGLRDPSYHTSPINCVTFSPDGKTIVSGSQDATVGLWDSKTGAEVHGRLHGHSAGVKCVAYSPSGQHVVSGSEDHSIRIWDVVSGSGFLEPIRGHTDWVNCIMFSPDSRLIASGSDDGTVRLWNAHVGDKFAEPLQIRNDFIKSLAFSSTGRYICAGSLKSLICIWEVDPGILLQQIAPDHLCSIYSVAFSPSEFQVASAGTDDKVSVWNCETGVRTLEPFAGHSDSVMSIAFSPDGKYIVSASVDMTICVWNAHTGALTCGPLRGHQQHILSVAFCPEGKRIVSGAADCTIRLWDLPRAFDVASGIEQPQLTSAMSVPGDWKGFLSELDLSGFDQIPKEIESSIPSWALRNLLQQNRWVPNSKNEHLLRVPEPYQRYNVDFSSLVLSSRISDSHVTFDFSHFQAGMSWERCKTST